MDVRDGDLWAVLEGRQSSARPMASLDDVAERIGGSKEQRPRLRKAKPAG